ncbi:MAG: polyprenyl synthetase family protein [Acidobacteria bacterium]|nr:polyprenyl synthetase family protein [Acidobacteriota bacterium]
MRYSVFAGGKRLRPLLARAAYEAAVEGPAESPADDGFYEAAAALELLHTYSLIHDDLPCMDDDALRRGKPTCHVVFGEAVALLAGDTLQTLAFEVLASRPAGEVYAARRAEAVAVVARAAGGRGMAGGQALDLAATGSGAAPSRALLHEIHAKKTGALLAASVELGAVLAGAGASRRGLLRAYGARLGLLFQIADDLLDATASSAALGKTAGKDAAQGKLTFPAVYGLDGTRRELERVLGEARAEAALCGDPEGLLDALAVYAARRDH